MLRRKSQAARRGGEAREDGTQRWQRNTVLRVNALLAFAAALITLWLSGHPLCEAIQRRAPEPQPAAGPPDIRLLLSARLGRRGRVGKAHAAFRVYYLGGALLTAALLGVGSLLLVGAGSHRSHLRTHCDRRCDRSSAASSADIPEAQDVLDLWPPYSSPSSATPSGRSSSSGSLSSRSGHDRSKDDPGGIAVAGSEAGSRGSVFVRRIRSPAPLYAGSSPRPRSRSHAHTSTPTTG